MYKETLSELDGLPADAGYTKAVRSLTQHRLNAVEQPTTDDEHSTLEQQLNAGCLEEVLTQAYDELALLRKMKEWKPWEPLQVTPAANQWTYFPAKGGKE